MLGDKEGKKIKEPVNDYVIFDLETTGVSSATDDIVEISAVKVSKGEVIDEFTSLVKIDRPMPAAASMVNGITDAMLKDAPMPEKVMKDFFDFIGDSILIGHNIYSFDLKFIYRYAKKYFGKTVTNDYVDTLPLARLLLPNIGKHTLTFLAEHYLIETDGAHRALNDCRMNQKVYECLKKEMADKAELLDAPICPKCGKDLVLRNGKFGSFYGCGGFPNCRYTQNVK